jgi:hypothetical protein
MDLATRTKHGNSQVSSYANLARTQEGCMERASVDGEACQQDDSPPRRRYGDESSWKDVGIEHAPKDAGRALQDDGKEHALFLCEAWQLSSDDS